MHYYVFVSDTIANDFFVTPTFFSLLTYFLRSKVHILLPCHGKDTFWEWGHCDAGISSLNRKFVPFLLFSIPASTTNYANIPHRFKHVEYVFLPAYIMVNICLWCTVDRKIPINKMKPLVFDAVLYAYMV